MEGTTSIAKRNDGDVDEAVDYHEDGADNDVSDDDIEIIMAHDEASYDARCRRRLRRRL